MQSTFLGERLAARRNELEEAIWARVCGASDPATVRDPRYVEGLRIAVAAAVDYGAAVADSGDRSEPSIPPALLVHARTAALCRVGLDTVLSSCSSGYAIFLTVLTEELGRSGLGESKMRQVLNAQAAGFDRLLSAIGEEYARQKSSVRKDGKHRRARLVRRLLAGEVVETLELNYRLDCWHLALVVCGAGADHPLRALATALDRAVLSVDGGGEVAWIWFGGRRPFDPNQLKDLLTSPPWSTSLTVALGEPGKGLSGWRLSHHQAAAVLPIALRSPAGIARYSDAPLLAAALRDDVLATSLRCLYLKPLEEERKSAALKATLRAYFNAAGNTSSAATALGISRSTVSTHLAAIENRVGRRVDEIPGELKVVLALDGLDSIRHSAGA